jgi:hypothetical protein
MDDPPIGRFNAYCTRLHSKDGRTLENYWTTCDVTSFISPCGTNLIFPSTASKKPDDDERRIIVASRRRFASGRACRHYTEIRIAQHGVEQIPNAPRGGGRDVRCYRDGGHDDLSHGRG